MGSLQCSIHKTWKVMKFCSIIFQAWQEPELVQVFQVLEIYTVTSLCMFFILFSINFLRYLQENLFNIIMYTAICHTVFYTFPKALTGKICLASLCIFSMLFSIHFLRYLQEEFVQQSRAALVFDHFLYTCHLHVWFRGNIVGEITRGRC